MVDLILGGGLTILLLLRCHSKVSMIINWKNTEVPFASITDVEGTQYHNVASLDVISGRALVAFPANGKVTYSEVTIKKPITVMFK